MVQFELQIATGNDAFQDGNAFPELARILRDLADRLEREEGASSGLIVDVNGNTVGRASWV